MGQSMSVNTKTARGMGRLSSLGLLDKGLLENSGTTNVGKVFSMTIEELSK